MYKLKITVLFFICFNYGFSQNTNGKVYYEKIINIDLNTLKDTPENRRVIESTKDLMNELKELKYILVFNANESVFKLTDEVENDSDRSRKVARMVGGGNGIYYTNLVNKERVHQKESYGTTFIIESSLDSIKWNFKFDAKLVGKYKCLKAVSEIKIQSRRGVETRKIIAWYSPKIKSSFGPLGYGGLPGLILELQIGKFAFRYKSIYLDNNQIYKISKPTRGKRLTQNEFDNLSKKMFENRGSLKN